MNIKKYFTVEQLLHTLSLRNIGMIELVKTLPDEKVKELGYKWVTTYLFNMHICPLENEDKSDLNIYGLFYGVPNFFEVWGDCLITNIRIECNKKHYLPNGKEITYDGFMLSLKVENNFLKDNN